MFVPLPALDDRRWSDLVEEGRSLIPLHAPDWTDHNISDPGITFTELFAWITEMEIFQLDQVPERHRLKFLSMLGIAPVPPVPARTVLRLDPPTNSPPFTLPESLECEGRDPFGHQVRVHTLHPIEVVATTLELIRSIDRQESSELTDRWRRGEPFPPFGSDPVPGAALVLGLSAPPPSGTALSIVVTATGAGSPVRDGHHSARTVWELRTGPRRWQRLDPRAGEVIDDSRCLTQDGRVRIMVPAGAHVAGGTGGELCHLRCRLVAGSFDQAPMLRDVAVNGVEAVQSVPAGELTWTIAADATIVGSAQRGTRPHIGLRFDAQRRIVRLDFGDEDAPSLFVLDYRAPSSGTTGVLTVEATRLGRGEDAPNQVVALVPAPVEAASLRLFTLERGIDGATWRHWSIRPDLDASTRADAHAVLDATAGTVTFGDGERGLVPPDGATIVARDRWTWAELGNLPAGAIDRVSESAHNAALLWASGAGRQGAATVAVTNPVPLAGGAAAESLEHAEGRAFELAAQATRAVTLTDYEQLALQTPGARLARATALANAHPALRCVAATGVVTVVVVPFLPVGRPMPSRGLLRAVAVHLCPRRIVGTRVEVSGPTYTDVSVRARVRIDRLARRGDLQTRVTAALDAFFDPLTGGPDRAGWPFGRDVHRLEVMQVIDEVPGVDHVEELELLTASCPQCGNVCLGPIGLVAAGAHQIEVIGP
jgi:predicted phage baseplate assembly protein